MVAIGNLNEHRRLADWLSEIYWTTPTRDGIAGLKPLSFEAVMLRREELVAMDRVIEGLEDAAVKEVALDYANLFCGFKPNAPFPYESIYRGEQRLLMQEPAIEVKKVYDANGYSPDHSISNEPADHIAYEFGYLSFLLDGAIAALEEGSKDQVDEFIEKKDIFVQEHAQAWVPVFCNEVSEQSDTEFFRLTASLTKQAISSIAQL